MIDDALRFVTSSLNTHVESVLGRDPEPYVVLSSLTAPGGAPAPGVEQRIILSLVNVERETSLGAGLAASPRGSADGFVRIAAPLGLNVYVLAAVNHSRYEEALKRLSIVTGFVQSASSWDALSSPGFPRDLQRLTVEFVNVDFTALNNLWGATGSKYLPSVLLKVRMITVDLGRADVRIPAIHGVERP